MRRGGFLAEREGNMEATVPLKGIKVADFCWIGAGPATIRYLAVWGATVVRVENHRYPDLLRIMYPYKDNKPGLNRAVWFAQLNSSTYGLSIDMNRPKGREIALKLIEWADLVTESFGPGTMKRWGLDYESVRKRRPDIVYFSSSQLGQTGPYATYIGYGHQAAAMGGLAYLTGWPDRLPISYQGAYPDWTSPRFGAATMLAALDYRKRTGKGVNIDLSQMESTAHLLAPVIMDYLVNGRVAERAGNSVSWAVPHGVYPCQGEDRWCAICISEEEEWEAFARTVGEAWAGDPRFSTFLARKKNEKDLDALIAQWTAKYEAMELEVKLQKAGVPAAQVNTCRDVLEEDTQLKHRGYFRRLKHSVIGEHFYRGPAFQLSNATDAQFPGPALGEHNEYVCKELLGLSDEEIAQAIIEGGITTDADAPPAISGF